MFRYCTDVLHLSEAQAYRRITAARLSRRFPVLLTMLEDGRLHLCGIAVISKHLTRANCEEVLARATHKSKRELEELVAEWAPKPDVPPTIRKKPRPSEPSMPSDEHRPERARGRGENEPPPLRPAAPEKRPSVAPLSPARYQVTFTASAELRDKLERLEALIPGSDLASVIDAAVPKKWQARGARSQAFRQNEEPENERRRRRHVTGCARHRCRGETSRMGARWRAVHVCRARRQTMSRAQPARVPSRRSVRDGWRS